MALVRSQSLDDRADRGSVGIQIAGQPGEHMWRTTEILREELFQEKTDGGGRDGRPPRRARTFDADPPQLRGSRSREAERIKRRSLRVVVRTVRVRVTGM